MEEHVVLVDERDRQVGTEEKIAAHRAGKLHRAFSLFVFNAKGEMLLQQRAPGKYHASGLWTNTCCSHPRPGEAVEAAVHRKLRQEMGFDCPVKKAFDFVYKVRFDNGLYEHEFDHVFVGLFDGTPQPNPDEASAWKWARWDELAADMAAHPERYTPWFHLAVQKLGPLRKELASLF